MVLGEGWKLGFGKMRSLLDGKILFFLFAMFPKGEFSQKVSLRQGQNIRLSSL